MGENNVSVNLELKECDSTFSQKTSIHQKINECKSWEDNIIKRFDEILSRMKRLEQHVPPIPSSQGHLGVLSIRTGKQFEKRKNKETTKCDSKENVKIKPYLA